MLGAANGSAVIESKAGRTKMVCLSTTHTEIVSLSECIRALVALRRLAEECGFIMRTPSRVDCDNEVAIKSSKLEQFDCGTFVAAKQCREVKYVLSL